MNTETKKFKIQIWDNLFPVIASTGSMLAITFLFFNTKILNDDFIQTLLALGASFIGIILSFFALKILRQKRIGNIFISYSHKDKQFVEKLVQSLKVKRFNIIYDQEVIRIGDNIKDTIKENILKSDLVIIVLSENLNKENFIQNELDIAVENSKKILPIILDSNVNLPFQLQEIKYADFSRDYDGSLRLLTKSLISSLEDKKTTR